ncbi:putative vitamin-D-receptor interacting Mediator subunit 4 [Lyophyllum shimeji]|uniref:Mediator of RNA polymerase II transcription subunit 4 n=1 Tax=Lyophyllum shimeji TaxID=47721 RepID=A0A9P3PV04_LYOSH|nr:putative vitamin-D-receptor interacting Mediator subunit 4 [Lyophyllum shimeji]
MSQTSAITGPSRPPPTNEPPSSTSAILLAPLNDLQALSHTLFLSLSPVQTKPPPPPPLSAFLACDEALSSGVSLARKHQIKQRRIDALEQEILDLEARWREIASVLESGKRELEEMIQEGEERIKAIEAAKKAAIPYPELLAYAQSISAFTSAPPNMPDLSLPGQPPPPLFFPPFPNEEKMRRGHLNAEAPLGLLGETHSVGRPPTVSPKATEADQQLAANRVHTLWYESAPSSAIALSHHVRSNYSKWCILPSRNRLTSLFHAWPSVYYLVSQRSLPHICSTGV